MSSANLANNYDPIIFVGEPVEERYGVRKEVHKRMGIHRIQCIPSYYKI